MKLEFQASTRTYIIKSPLVMTFQGEVVSNKVAAQIKYTFVMILIDIYFMNLVFCLLTVSSLVS